MSGLLPSTLAALQAEVQRQRRLCAPMKDAFVIDEESYLQLAARLLRLREMHWNKLTGCLRTIGESPLLDDTLTELDQEVANQKEKASDELGDLFGASVETQVRAAYALRMYEAAQDGESS